MKAFPRLLLILAAFLAIFQSSSHAVVVDKIRAVVNDEIITQSEIDRILYPIYLRYKDIYNGKELDKKLNEATNEILNQLIDDKVLLSEARKQGILVSEEEIEYRVENLKSSLPAEESLEDILKRQNLTINDIRKQVKEQIMVERLLDMEIRRRIQILPQEAEIFYQNHLDEFKEEEQVLVSGILIRTKGERTKEQNLSLAVNLLHRLKKGEDFFAIAKNYSEGTNAEQGGDMGYVRKGQMIDEIDKALFKLGIGDISDLVETPLGYYIFKVYDKKKERTLPLSDARTQIIDAIYREKAEVKYGEWIKTLKKDAFISIK